MKDEQFEKEITDLYQQRKSQIVAPSISMTEPSSKSKRSFVSLFSIFALGGAASFGIMAIITHFAKSPQANLQNQTIKHQVNITEKPSPKPDETVILIKPELPPKPPVPPLNIKPKLLKPVKNSTQVNDVDNVELNVVHVASLPQLKEPELSINPTYKVMPKYSQKALQDNQSGAIRLRYEIDASGNVTNINVMESKVSRELQRSAKKALAKWKYNPEDNIQSSYEIIFEFNSGR